MRLLSVPAGNRGRRDRALALTLAIGVGSLGVACARRANIPSLEGLTPDAHWSPPAVSPLNIPIPAGVYYSYAPSVIQDSPTSRHVLFCGNTISGIIHDHVMRSVGTLTDGVWSYSAPEPAFGPEQAGSASDTAWFNYNTCDPEAVQGAFNWNGHIYSWAVLFTGEGCSVMTPLDAQGVCPTGDGVPNQVGVAYADSLDAAPDAWQVDPTPLISAIQEFGQACSSDQFCVGQPSATSVDGAGQILVFYTGKGFSRRLVDLSSATKPAYRDWVKLPRNGLPNALDNASFVYDPPTDRFLVSFDTGPFNGGKLQPETTVASLDGASIWSGAPQAEWSIQGTFGSCLTGSPYNHNSGIVRTGLGVLPKPTQADVVFTTSDGNTPADSFGTWTYRMWEADAPLGPLPAHPVCQ